MGCGIRATKLVEYARTFTKATSNLQATNIQSITTSVAGPARRGTGAGAVGVKGCSIQGTRTVTALQIMKGNLATKRVQGASTTSSSIICRLLAIHSHIGAGVVIVRDYINRVLTGRRMVTARCMNHHSRRPVTTSMVRIWKALAASTTMSIGTAASESIVVLVCPEAPSTPGPITWPSRSSSRGNRA